MVQLNPNASAWVPKSAPRAVDSDGASSAGAGAPGADGGGKPPAPGAAPIAINITASAPRAPRPPRISVADGDGSASATPRTGGAGTPSGDLDFDDVFDLAASRRTSVAEQPETPRCGGAAPAAAAVEEPTLATFDAGDEPGSPTCAAAAAAAAAVPAACPAAAAALGEALAAWQPCAGGAAAPGAASTSSGVSDAGTSASATSDAAAVEQARLELRCDGPVQSCAATGMPENTKVGPRDFDILKVVGQGAFGKVFQVRHRGTGQIYAMKVMRKERILEKDHSDYVRAERDVLTAVVHPYIVTLRFSFQTPSKLYLVLDFINGGHLFFNLYRAGVFDEAVAKLYTAEMVCALSYLHGRGIVHRDLKPENVLLDSEGHVKLTDFGLAKGNMGEKSRTNSFIGTMEYMAPEIIESKGHAKAVDWWSTGILLYEMLAGVPPFRAKSRQALQQQITSGKIKWPKFLSPNALSLLKGLLTRDPEKRLGAGPNGSAAIRAHPFFKGINWQALEQRAVPSSFKPSISHSLSVENFDALWTDQRPEDSPCGTPTDPAYLSAFEGFTFVSPSFFSAAMAARDVAAAAAAAAPAAQGCP